MSNSYLTAIVHTWVLHSAPHTVYEFRVQAETEVGPGPFSDSTQFTTPEDGMIIVISTTVLQVASVCI